MTIRAVLIVCAFVLLTASPPRGASAADRPLDLPAITLMPSDVAALGLTGYGRFGNGEFRSLDDYVARRAAFLNTPEVELRAAFEAAGWEHGYVANLALPAEPGNPESPPRQEVFSVINEYADAAGAAVGYDLNRDYAGVTEGVLEVLAGSRTFGDASYLTHLTVPGSAERRPEEHLDLTLRFGAVVASTGVIAFGDDADLDAATPPSPETIAQVEAMAARLLERIERVVAGESPGLSNRTLRFGGDEAPIAFATEGYRRLDGDDPPYYNGYQDDFGGDPFAGVVAAYELNQGVAAPGDPYYVVRLLQFADDVQAAAYLARVRAEGLSPAGTPAADVAGAATIGDESWTIGYGAEFEPGHPIAGFAVFARVGATTFMLLLEGGIEPARATVEALAVAQAGCLTSGSCPPSTPVPAEFVAPPAA